MCPWPAVIWVEWLIACWELERPRVIWCSPAGNMALMVLVQALMVSMMAAFTRETPRSRMWTGEGRSV